MTQESSNPETPPATPGAQWAETPPAPAPPSEPVITQEPPPPPADPAPAARSRRPLWPLLLVAAIVPAVIVGLIVFFVAGGDADSGSDNAAGIVDGLIRLGPSEESTVTSYKNELPPDFATDFPMYGNADVVVSIAIASPEGTSYFIVLSTDDPSGEVYDFYSTALDEGVWQVEVGRASADFTGLAFLRPDNIDVSGDITLHQSDLDDKTAIYLSYNDISQSIVPGAADAPFALGNTRPLPPGFPEDVPIYDGDEETVVLDTYFERAPGGQAFIVSFLTKNSQDDVIDFYTAEFESRGWNVTDAGVLDTSFALSIDFDDADAQSLSGSITANNFEEDSSYTKVDMLVTVSPTRSRGN